MIVSHRKSPVSFDFLFLCCNTRDVVVEAVEVNILLHAKLIIFIRLILLHGVHFFTCRLFFGFSKSSAPSSVLTNLFPALRACSLFEPLRFGHQLRRRMDAVCGESAARAGKLSLLHFVIPPNRHPDVEERRDKSRRLFVLRPTLWSSSRFFDLRGWLDWLDRAGPKLDLLRVR